MDMMDDIKRLWKESKNVVFFGGAGVSTDSGIPDFRGTKGLYTAPNEYEERPEEMLHTSYLSRHPEKFFAYYKKNMIYPNAKPNTVHKILAKWEKAGKLTAVITQNIDGLHQMAGSQNVIELHGSTLRNTCVHCGKTYPLSYIMASDGVPVCEVCGGVVRPDVVLYGENLDMDAFTRAERALMRADLVIVGGTSLTVNPAASLIGLVDEERLLIINQSRTPYDRYAAYAIHDSLSETLAQMDE